MTEHPFEPVDHGDPVPHPPEAHSHDAWPGWSTPGHDPHLDDDQALQFAAAAEENERWGRADPDAGGEAPGEPTEPSELAEPAGLAAPAQPAEPPEPHQAIDDGPPV